MRRLNQCCNCELLGWRGENVIFTKLIHFILSFTSSDVSVGLFLYNDNGLIPGYDSCLFLSTWNYPTCRTSLALLFPEIDL